MRKLAALAFLTLVLAASMAWWGAGQPPAAEKPAPLPWPAGLPVYDHVVIVVEENKDYEQIIHSDLAPYINALRAEGANFTQMYGEEHNSQGNYFWLFSGSNHNVGFDDVVPCDTNHPGYPFRAPNLGAALIAGGRTFKGYAEDLPAIGSKIGLTLDAADRMIYARKHVPWISFANVPHGNTVATSSNLRFADFPTDEAGFAKLPTVAFVIPNQDHDMHNVDPKNPGECIRTGDAWLKKHLDGYYRWAKTHNSLLIVTFDESDNKSNYLGLTNPLVKPDCQLKRDLQNRIATIFAGAHIKAGDYPEGKGITHVNILRTLEAMYGLPRSGAQQPNAAGAGIRDDYLITDVFTKVK
jgi:acid phosphatase